MSRVERKFNEKMILSYKETHDESLFDEIIQNQDIRKYVSYVCRQKLRHCPTTLFSFDDFYNLSFFIIWQSIEKYRFICPKCLLKAKSGSDYRLHMIVKHHEISEPVVSITRFIKYNLGAYLQNEIKKEYSLERKSNVMTINIFSPDDTFEGDDADDSRNQYDIVSSELVEEAVTLQDVVELVVSRFDSLTRQVFMYLYYDCLKQSEIATILHRQGRYSSEQSAKVVISRIVKNNIRPAFLEYYPNLGV